MFRIILYRTAIQTSTAKPVKQVAQKYHGRINAMEERFKKKKKKADKKEPRIKKSA